MVLDFLLETIIFRFKSARSFPSYIDVLVSEVELLWRVKHPNLLGLVGYCQQARKDEEQ